MAPPQRVYTHGDLEAHALQNYPDTYSRVSAIPYIFVSQTLAEVVTPAQTDLLQVAYWNFKNNNVVVWARILSNKNSYYLIYFKKEEGLTDAGQPYPDGRSNIQAYVAPFKHIPPRKWPENIARREKARLDAREQFALSVKFAFLHTGRIRRITSAPETDLHDVFEQLCGKIPDADDDTEDDTETDPASASRPSVKVLGKRPVVDLSSEDEYTEPYARLSLEPTNRRKPSRLDGDDLLPAFGVGEAPPEPSEKMKKLVAAMTEQAVAEALNNQDEDRRDLEKNFKRIEKELANQKKETLEWKAKYTTLQNDVQKAQKALGKTQK